jgi:putative MATE family efflux protein
MPTTTHRYDRSIVDGPLRSAVWKIAWPTMLTNVVGGLQGIVDHALVGHLVGFRANAAIGVSWQIMLVVIIFISSLFTGMSVLVARFAGAGEPDKVDRTVYQAFLTAVFLSFGIMAPIGYFASPWLLDLVNAAPAVKAEALPFLRVMFLFSSGMLLFYMLSGALRSAGDARTPMVLGIALTVLNLVLNVILIRGLGPLPGFGTVGSAMGTVAASWIVGGYSLWKLWSGGWVVHFRRGQGWGPDWSIIRELFRFGLPTGIQGIAMNIGGVILLGFIGSLAQSAAAQAAFAVSYTQLFSLVTWTSVGLMGAAAAVAGQNLGAGHPDRADAAVHVAARFGLGAAAIVGFFFLFFPRHERASRGRYRSPVAPGAECFRAADRGRAYLYGGIAGDWRYQEPAVHLDRVADRGAAGYLLRDPADRHAGPDRHLGRHSPGPPYPVRPERAPLQPGQVARHHGGDRTRGQDSVIAINFVTTARTTPVSYVGGFLLPIPKRNVSTYRRIAPKAGRVGKEHGALEYRECVGDDLKIKGTVPFPRTVKVKPGETVVFSWPTGDFASW